MMRTNQRLTSVLHGWFLSLLTAGRLAALVHTRAEVQIAMPDIHPVSGQPVTLAADRYLPKVGSGPWPTILVQTPYGKGNSYLQFLTERAQDPLFNSTNYAWVVMDWRGFGVSGSETMAYSGSPRPEQDGYAAVEWVSRQSWCVPGKVGTWGVSALGNIQARTAALRPPSLVCAVPIAYHWREWYDQCYPGGVYARNRNDFVYGLFGGLSAIRAVPLRTAIWDTVEASTGTPSDIGIPMLHITGWYDHETLQTMREMQALQSGGGPGAVGRQKLLVGPWSHGAMGLKRQNQLEYPAAEFADSREALRFFDHHLRGATNGWEDRPTIRVFQMNEDAWVAETAWPPSAVVERTFHFLPDRTLARPRPIEAVGSLSWVADPTNPAPSLCSALVHPAAGETQGPGDLTALESRPDVMVFTTPPLREPLVIAGNGRATLWVGCSAIDTDVHVRLTQVYPDGRSMWLGDAVRRLSLRNGYSAHEWLQPGTDYPVTLELPPLAVTLPPRHRLRVLVCSANTDRSDVNLQDGSDLSDEPGAKPVQATVTLSVNAVHSSSLVLPCRVGSELDSDADGLPDWWETLYFGDPVSAASGGDPDGDGVTNVAELEAGTDPGDVLSFLALHPLKWLREPQAGISIRWTSVAERDYRILQSYDLATWSVVAEGVIGTPPSNEWFLATGAGDVVSRYVRIETRR